MGSTHTPDTCTIPESHAVCTVCGECCYRVAASIIQGRKSVWMHKRSEWEMPTDWEMHAAQVTHYVDGVKVVA